MALNTSNLTDNGSTTSIDWNGGKGAMLATGTWGSGTLTLQFSIDGGTTWATVGTDTTITADGGGIFTLPRDVKVRATLSGATAPDLDVAITGVQE